MLKKRKLEPGQEIFMLNGRLVLSFFELALGENIRPVTKIRRT